MIFNDELNLRKPISFFLAINQVAIHTGDVADTMNAIEITGANSAKNYIPIKREGSEPSKLSSLSSPPGIPLY